MSIFFGDKRFGMAKLLMAPMTDDEVAAMKSTHEKALKEANDKFAAEKAEWEKTKGKNDPPNPNPNPDPDKDKSLADKARLEREEAEKKTKYEKSLGSAMKFNMAGKDFIKNNDGLLPKNIEGIFTQAEKQNFDSEIAKANEIKVGVVSEFFAVQANHDLLTDGQKSELEDFLKLTKNKQQDRVESVYAMIFEPTLETLRKVQKAKQLSNGSKDQSSAEKALADRMMKASKAHYLGDKQ